LTWNKSLGFLVNIRFTPEVIVKSDSPSDPQAALPGVMDHVDVSFTRARAILVASRLKPILLKHCLRSPSGKPLCQLAGSLRRRARHVHDIDIVVSISRTPDDLMAPEQNPRSSLREDIIAREGEIVSWGPDHARFIFEEVPVDIYFTKPSRFAVALVVATGSAHHLRKLDLRARERKLRLQPENHLIQRQDQSEIVMRSEDEVYSILGMPYQSPQMRA
jgi:DNA polymerase/3'-5' exonuclease PolX